MLCSRRESHHSNGITEHDSLQLTSATKSAKSRHCAILFDHLVGDREQPGGHIDAKRARSLQVDGEIEFSRLLNGQVSGFGASEYFAGLRAPGGPSVTNATKEPRPQNTKPARRQSLFSPR